MQPPLRPLIRVALLALSKQLRVLLVILETAKHQQAKTPPDMRWVHPPLLPTSTHSPAQVRADAPVETQVRQLDGLLRNRHNGPVRRLLEVYRPGLRAPPPGAVPQLQAHGSSSMAAEGAAGAGAAGALGAGMEVEAFDSGRALTANLGKAAKLLLLAGERGRLGRWGVGLMGCGFECVPLEGRGCPVRPSCCCWQVGRKGGERVCS